MNGAEEPEVKSTKVVWTKCSSPVLDDHTEEYKELKSKRMRNTINLV